MKYKNLIGDTFGRLTIVNHAGSNKRGDALWLCKCECGHKKILRGSALRAGHVASCGCLKPIPIDNLPNGFKVLNFVGRNSYHYNVYRIHCHCGNTFETTLARIKSGHTKSCGCYRRRSGKASKTFTGYEEISGVIWKSIKRGAITRKLVFQITLKDIWELFLKQNRRCALTSLPLVFGSLKTNKTTASLDRIDSNQGYFLENVQWLHRDINLMKQNLPQEKFLEYCRLLSKYNPSSV